MRLKSARQKQLTSTGKWIIGIAFSLSERLMAGQMGEDTAWNRARIRKKDLGPEGRIRLAVLEMLSPNEVGLMKKMDEMLVRLEAEVEAAKGDMVFGTHTEMALRV